MGSYSSSTKSSAFKGWKRQSDSPRRRAKSVAAIGLLGGLLGLGSAGFGAQTAQASTVTGCAVGSRGTATAFGFTGSEQCLALPSGTSQVTVTATGAGGSSDGLAGVVNATVAVPAGTSTLYVEVGGKGSGSAGGFNGGGGGGGGGYYSSGRPGSGGGGASDVRTVSCATTCTPASAMSRLVVAAGGGGRGGASSDGNSTAAGSGGYYANGSGTAGSQGGAYGDNPSGYGGGGATVTVSGSGGAGFSGFYYFGGNGASGTVATGGGGGGATIGGGGGGGGGGYFGGGGGGGGSIGFSGYYDYYGSGGSGGGGSSYGPSDSVFTPAVANAPSQVTITPIDNDLAISQAANVITDATSPSGAAVAYIVPTVTDEDSAAVKAICTPSTGSTFVIGVTSVTCTVTDTDDSPSSVSTTFTVTVKGAAAQLVDLAGAVSGLSPGSSFPSKVQSAQATLAAGDTTGTCGILNAFVHEAKAQAGKSLTTAQAAQLEIAALQIRAVLGC